MTRLGGKTRHLVKKSAGVAFEQKLAAEIDWAKSNAVRPPQSWLDDKDDNPFEPEEDRAS